MHRSIGITFLLALATGVRAEAAPQSPVHAHLYFGSVKESAREGKPLLLGGGVERRIHNGFTVAADLSYLYTHPEGFGLLALGSGYHFVVGEEVSPFVNAGYGLAFHGLTRNFFYFGGGLTRWVTPKVGARVEVHDSIAPSACGCATDHVLQFRIGLALR